MEPAGDIASVPVRDFGTHVGGADFVSLIRVHGGRVFETLPSGRHRLTREQVSESQRHRLLLGMAEVMAERGYPRSSVADVLVRAHVSRGTFYQYFTDKQDCFLALLDECGTAMFELLEGELAGSVEPALARFDKAMAVYLESLAAEPDTARVFFLESYAAGPQGAKKRFAIQERFVASVVALFSESGHAAVITDVEFACRALVGAISSLVASVLASGNAADLPGLRPRLSALLRELLDN